MGSNSQASFDNPEQLSARLEHIAREKSPPPGPKGRVDSNDIRELGSVFGGQFLASDRKDSYPRDIDIDISEEGNGKSDPASQLASSSHHSPSGEDSTSLTTSSAASLPGHLVTTGPYLSETEFLRLPLHRRRRSRHTHDSGPETDSSAEYLSARGYPNSAPTTYDADSGNEAGDDDGLRESTPFFTPTNTPPPPSEATTEDRSEPLEIRAPDSPFPYSNYNTYNAGYGVGVVKTYEQSHEQHK